jgi:hypothetical protein
MCAMGIATPRLIVVSVFVSVLLLLAYLSRERLAQHQPPPEEKHDDPPVPKFETWGIKDLSEVISVASVRVRTAFQDASLPIKQETDLAFAFTDVNVAQPVPELAYQTATILAPTHHTADASSLMIGLATTLDRLRDSLPAFAHWASGTRVKFVVVIKPQEPGGTTIDEITKLYTAHHISITLVESALPWYDQYVSLLAVLHDHASPTTKWTCIMDDDTYFFSMARVLAMLAKYDHTQPYYIGGLTENKDGIDRIGILGFGGAGVFLSLPLLKQLRPYNERCIALPDDAGDIRVRHCIHEFSLTKFTWEHYLFQMDLHGDVTGFYEAARTRPVSTHHWHSWHFHDMAKVGAVGDVCGNECVLQKYTLRDGYMLTNGFSIVKYSWTEEEDAQFIDGTMEHTWAETIWVKPNSWNYTLVPLRPKDPDKIQYVIEKVDEDEREMTVYYVRRRKGLGSGIVRMTWEKDVVREQ